MYLIKLKTNALTINIGTQLSITFYSKLIYQYKISVRPVFKMKAAKFNAKFNVVILTFFHIKCFINPLIPLKKKSAFKWLNNSVDLLRENYK